MSTQLFSLTSYYVGIVVVSVVNGNGFVYMCGACVSTCVSKCACVYVYVCRVLCVVVFLAYFFFVFLCRYVLCVCIGVYMIVSVCDVCVLLAVYAVAGNCFFLLLFFFFVVCRVIELWVIVVFNGGRSSNLILFCADAVRM